SGGDDTRRPRASRCCAIAAGSRDANLLPRFARETFRVADCSPFEAKKYPLAPVRGRGSGRGALLLSIGGGGFGDGEELGDFQILRGARQRSQFRQTTGSHRARRERDRI